MKSQMFLLLALVAIALMQCAAVSLQVNEEAFPPVIFSYNATACDACKCACRTKFDRLHLLERNACRGECDLTPDCTHWQPADTKPEPETLITVNPVLAAAASSAVASGAINATMLAASNGNCTDALIKVITPPTPEYVGAEDKPEDPIAFFTKLQAYIAWKTAQSQTSNFTAPEFKEGQAPTLQLPVVCTACVHAALQTNNAYVLAHVVDKPDVVVLPPVKNETVPVKNDTVEQPVVVPPLIPIPATNTTSTTESGTTVPAGTVTTPTTPAGPTAPAGTDLPPL